MGVVFGRMCRSCLEVIDEKLVRNPALIALAKVSSGGQKNEACRNLTFSGIVGASSMAFNECPCDGSMVHNFVGCREPCIIALPL